MKRPVLTLRPGDLILFGLLGLASVYPLGRFLLLPLFPSLGPAATVLSGADAVVPVSTVMNTLQVGVGVGLLVIPPGLALGFLLERRQWAGNRAVAGLIWLTMLMPSYLVTSGWQIVTGSTWLKGSWVQDAFYSEFGLIALIAVKALPFACFSSRASWAAIGSEIGDALLIHVDSAWQRMLVPLRLMIPAAAAIFVVAFIEGIQDFGIAATLGAQIHLPLLIYTIYTRLAITPVQFATASLLSWYLLIMAAAAVAAHLWIASKMTAVLVNGRQRKSVRTPCSASEWIWGSALLCLLGATGVFVPAVALVVQAVGPVKHPLQQTDWDALLFSGRLAFIAAAASVALAACLAARARDRRGGRSPARLMDLLSFGNMAIPGLLLGAAYVVAFNTDWLPLYGTPWLLILAYVAGQAPMLTRFLMAPTGQIHTNMSDAARLHGIGWISRIVDIHLPLLLRPLLWGWMISFGHVMFELPVSALLAPAGRQALAVRLLNLNGLLQYDAEARLALMAALVCLLVVAAVSLLAREPRSGASRTNKKRKDRAK